MKSIWSILCLFLLVRTSYCLSANNTRLAGTTRSANNLILCADPANTRLAYSYILTREALFLRTRVETLVWPSSVDQNLVPISCIRVLDQISNNGGGYVELRSGGIGFTYVELVFTSKWSSRMSFDIEIYVNKN